LLLLSQSLPTHHDLVEKEKECAVMKSVRQLAFPWVEAPRAPHLFVQDLQELMVTLGTLAL
jgi:hypothetical protein